MKFVSILHLFRLRIKIWKKKHIYWFLLYQSEMISKITLHLVICLAFFFLKLNAETQVTKCDKACLNDLSCSTGIYINFIFILKKKQSLSNFKIFLRNIKLGKCILTQCSDVTNCYLYCLNCAGIETCYGHGSAVIKLSILYIILLKLSINPTLLIFNHSVIIQLTWSHLALVQ
jgi:hypothetical protein